MYSRLLFAFVLLCVSLSAAAQMPRSFTHEKQAFYDELSKMLSDADKKEAKALLDGRFDVFWLQSNVYDEAQTEKIYVVADMMLKKKLRPFPYFESLVNILMAFPGSPQEGEDFDTWVEIVQALDANSRSDLEDFILKTEDLLATNTFYRSKSTQWKVDKPAWSFEVLDRSYAVHFGDVDLICIARDDSSVIHATTGKYLPKDEKFFGEGGKITWTRAGLDPNETYAIIERGFEIGVRSSFYTIDSVLFFNAFFDHPLQGMVEDKLLASVTPENAKYPQFSSYNKLLAITDVVDKVDYSGGFRMEGAHLQGFGTPDEPATLTFKRDGLPQLITRSQFYTIKPDQISSQQVELVVLLNNDSIVHPALQLRFRNDNRMLTLMRTNEGFGKSPYYDSYHNLELHFEAFYWNIDDPIIKMGNLFGSTETRAAFESANYFKQSRYRQIQGMDRINPLYAVRSYARQVNSEVFSAESLAHSMGYQLDMYVPRLIQLAAMGFIDYDLPTQTVRVNQKLYDYISAAAGNIDYDVIQFNSDVRDGNNAELNLSNFDLMLRGVDHILLSDSQQVAIFPKNGEVNVRKNRDFNFGGVIRSGKFEFYGQEFAFDYDKFQIDLISVDSCRLYVDDFRPESNALRRVKSVIEGIGGTLQIDNPYNKSGMQTEFTQYPILTSDRESYVYYDNSAIQGGVYERDRVYFELEPFILDSLDNFATEQVAFEGRFVSGGIFPEITEQLRVQRDYSLGFEQVTPPDGMPLYGNKATFTDKVMVNYSGIQGDGDLNYLTATARSDRFTFFPDSTRGLTTSFENVAVQTGTEVPDAKAGKVDLSFYPIDDLLTAEVVDDPIALYEGQAMVQKGLIGLSPEGMIGEGVVEFSGAELESDLITYNYETFDSDTADFRLLAMQEANLAFRTDNVKAHIDFANRVGEFTSNGDETLVEFPVNEYICYMDEFKWFMDRNDIALETSREMLSDFVIDTELDMSRSNFFSVAEGQDSLNFMSPKAVYDLDNYMITADEIPWIRVADAKIVPDDGRVIIRRKARMEPLENAEITANYVTQYHTITDATVQIASRNSYTAQGSYAYVDQNKNPQIIHFRTVEVDSSLQTVAEGLITTENSFTLSPHFEFRGTAYLNANEKFLTFEGGTRIIHACEGLERNWMTFRSVINPEEVLIPVDSALVNDEGDPVEIGVEMTIDPYTLYGTFLSEAHNPEDHSVLSSRGLLRFNPAAQQYEVADPDKLKQTNLPGNFVALQKNQCTLTGMGEIELAQDLGLFDMNTIGNLDFDPQGAELNINASLVLDFFFNDKAMDLMRTYLAGVPELKPMDFAKSNYEYAIREIMGLEASDKIISELSLSGNVRRMPDALAKSLFLSDLVLKWDPVLEAFVSEGSVGIASIGKNHFFREVPGKVAIEKRKSGDVVHLYLEVDDAHWYYFNYKRGVLQAVSSDQEFNTLLMEEKEDKRKKSGEKKSDDYLYMMGSKNGRGIFVDQFMF